MRNFTSLDLIDESHEFINTNAPVARSHVTETLQKNGSTSLSPSPMTQKRRHRRSRSLHDLPYQDLKDLMPTDQPNRTLECSRHKLRKEIHFTLSVLQVHDRRLARSGHVKSMSLSVDLRKQAILKNAKPS